MVVPCLLWLSTVMRVISTLAYPVSNPTGSDGAPDLADWRQWSSYSFAQASIVSFRVGTILRSVAFLTSCR